MARYGISSDGSFSVCRAKVPGTYNCKHATHVNGKVEALKVSEKLVADYYGANTETAGYSESSVSFNVDDDGNLDAPVLEHRAQQGIARMISDGKINKGYHDQPTINALESYTQQNGGSIEAAAKAYEIPLLRIESRRYTEESELVRDGFSQSELGLDDDDWNSAVSRLDELDDMNVEYVAPESYQDVIHIFNDADVSFKNTGSDWASSANNTFDHYTGEKKETLIFFAGAWGEDEVKNLIDFIS